MAHHPLEKIKRITASETWQLRHEVMWPSMPFEFIKLPEDEAGEHFGFFLNEELVSVISVFYKSEGIAQFRKFATKKTMQGKGYGTKLLAHLISYVEKQQMHTLWCNARVDKTAFYKRFGMIETNKTYIKEHLKFVILEKKF